MKISNLKTLWSRFLADRSGITGLETAIVLIAFVVVAAVFAFTVLTTGLFTSEKAKETALAGVATTSSSLVIKGSIIAGDPDDNDDVDYLRLKLATATGVEQVLLDPDQLVVTYTDDNNVVLLQNGATELGGATQDPATINDDIDTCVAEPTAVFCMYRDGGNNVLDPGEVWEMAITLDHLAAAGGALKANSKFMVEVLPQDGAALIFERRTPLDITPIMNLD